MKTLAVSAIVLGAGLGFAVAPAHAMSGSGIFTGGAAMPIIHVAHAGEPYKNVDHRNDAGNDTGDSQVDRLNEQSLQRARGEK